FGRRGRVDLLVNNAGYGRHVLFKDHDVADIERMMRTNYLGTVYATKAVLPEMRGRGRGWIVNVSSVAGKLGQPDEAAYSASKFAVAGLSEALSYELAPLGIHVMTVYPALVRADRRSARLRGRLSRALADDGRPGELLVRRLHADLAAHLETLARRRRRTAAHHGDPAIVGRDRVHALAQVPERLLDHGSDHGDLRV